MKHTAWPSWRYGPNGEAAVFATEADVPKGWHDHPSKHAEKAEKAASSGTENSSPEKSKPGRKPKTEAPLDL